MSSSDRDESSGSTLADAVVAALAKQETAAAADEAILPGNEVTEIAARQVIVAVSAPETAEPVKAAEAPTEKDTEKDVEAARTLQAEASAAEASAAEASAAEASDARHAAQNAEAQAAAQAAADDAPEIRTSSGDSTLPPPPDEPEPEGIRVRYYGRTDVGLVREHNEDNYLVANLTSNVRGNTNDMPLLAPLESRGFVFAVCDGMGGAAAGEVASQMAVDTVHEMLANGTDPRDRDHYARRLVRAVEEAGSRIFMSAKMDRSRRGMGTTSTVAGLVDSTLFVGQVGDSRAYVLRGDQFALITKDQSLVNQLIDAGQLTEEQAEAFEYSNIILQALGTTEEVNVDLTFLELRRGDRLLLCSDGLSGLVHAEMMKDVLRAHRDQVEAARQLIAMANSGGGHDNITVVIADFDGLALKEPVPEARVAYQQYPLPPAPADAGDDPAPGPPGDIKPTGGPKPGRDVKTPVEAPSRWWLVAVLIVLVVALFGAIYVAMEEEEAVAPARTTLTTPEARPVTAHLSFDGAYAGESLMIDGEAHGTLTSGGMLLEVRPGRHSVRVLHGEEMLAEVDVSVAARESVSVHLPARVNAPPSLDEAIPSGVEVPAAPHGVEPPSVEPPAEVIAQRPRDRATGDTAHEPPPAQ
jgi:protein phosphatase